MDYTSQPLTFKIKKSLRYINLYGIRRTLAKINGQYHMKKRYETLPQLPGNPNGHVGILGCGNFAYSNIAYYLYKCYGQVIKGCMDVDINHAASLADRYKADYFTDDPQRVIEDKSHDLIYIVSNHASHAEYAIDAIKHGKAVHIEKPHVVSEDQLVRLCTQMLKSDGKVELGFNRPNSRIARTIKKHLDEESGSMMLNWFVAGHEINPDHWYFHEEEGGRILGNLCHWTDFIIRMVPEKDRFPIQIQPTRADRSDCDIAVTYVFGDGSIAIITFSAKGHTFEGVRERFSAHRGNALFSMDDYKTMLIEVVDRRIKMKLRHRDHGHRTAVKRSYNLSPRSDEKNPGASVEYVWDTGQLFLKTKEALENRKTIVLESFDKSDLASLRKNK